MRQYRHPCWIAAGIAVCTLALCCPVWAQQITSDGTLSTSVTSPDGRNFIIKDGNRAGGNLFHSFSQFSVPTGGEAFFDNVLDVDNIIGRVTGGEVSNIDGLLRANYGANLFLLNPNGIIFGANARLNIGGSFIGSSAHSVSFADGTTFSATNPPSAPLLTVSVPVGLGLASNPGAIQVQGTGNSLTLNSPFSPTIGAGSNLTGLLVQPGKTLALVGGDVALEGGTLTAERGRIELGSVGDGLVSLSPTTSGWTLGYEGVQSFQDIRLSQKASLDASGNGDGSIQVQGRRVSVRDGSQILIQNQGFQPAKAIFVNASESLKVSGTSPDNTIPSRLVNETVGVGNGGDIAVSTKRLVLQNGGAISTTSYSAATGGNLAINASNSVQVIGFSPVNPTFASSIFATTFSSGNAGDLTLSTERLSVLGGANVSSSTVGTGKGGHVTVNATESIELIGFNQIVAQPSNLAASTLNAGDAGSLTINTSRLAVLDGAGVDASTLATGNAGSIIVNASESVEVSGTGSEVFSSAEIVPKTIQEFLSLPPVPSGGPGNVTINTRALRVTDGAVVGVQNDGSGNAGNLEVNASSIFLNNQGRLTAATTSGEGGNIFLQAQNLQLRDNSAITATAGGSGNGGNLTITTSTLVALENSDITANAIEGRGGNIQLSTQGLFLSPTSEITASSNLGVDGVVDIQTPEVDPSSGLVTLPEDVVDVIGLVAQGCSAGAELASSEFIVTGRGGLPFNPSGTISSETVLVDLGPAAVQSQFSGNAISTKLTSRSSAQIVEAQGWVVKPNGKVILTANAPHVTLHSPWLNNAACNRR
jgi:filamentous hemagglutinin family protein